jgi:hypothetical protein
MKRPYGGCSLLLKSFLTLSIEPCLLDSRFSVVGRRPQGELLGWFASAGSLARIIFPIMSGYVANFSSMEMVFATLVGVLILSTAFILWARETLTLLSS